MPESKMGFEHLDGQHRAGLGDLLWDAHAAGSKILDFTAGRTADDFASHEVLRAAVARMLQIVIISLEGLRLRFPEHFARLEHAERALALTPRLTDNTEVWRFVQEVLPALIAEVAVELEDWHSA